MRLDLVAGQIVDRLATAGLAATVDPRDLDTPAVWVQLNSLDLPRFKAGYWAATWDLTIIVADTGTTQAMATLGTMADQLLSAFPHAAGGTPAAILLPGGPDPMPALQFTVHLLCTDTPDQRMEAAPNGDPGDD
jgi:hypothetical protein